MRKIFTISLLLVSFVSLWAVPRRSPSPKQISDGASSHIKVSYALDLTPEQLVRQALLGSGVTVSNVTFNSSSAKISTIEGGRQIGTFVNNLTLFPEFEFTDGLVMTTGYIENTEGPNTETDVTTMVTEDLPYMTTYKCDLLTKMESGDAYNNPAVLEFDFSASTDIVAFRYIFASDEYPEYTHTDYNDMFAFYITDLTTNVTKNIAIIPGTTQTVCINNVNQYDYKTYYHEVPIGSDHMEFDAYLTPFTAQSKIVPNRIYHMTLVICHRADYTLDSGVFIEGHSFKSVSSTDYVDACDSYFWEGTIYTESGTYQQVYHISEEVDSVAELYLRIHHPTSDTIDLTVCSSELPYTWRDTVFDTNTTLGTHSFSFQRKSIYGCDSAVLLNLKVLMSYNQQESLTICANELPYTWRDTVFDVNTTAENSYTFHRQSVLGCDSIVTLHLKVLPSYRDTVWVNICPNRLPYEWGDTIFDTNTPFGTQTYSVSRQTIHGCDSIVTLQLKVQESFDVTIYDQIYVDSTYNNHRFDLSAHTIPGDYTYVHHDYSAFGCDSTTTLYLKVLPEPFVPSIPVSPTICGDDMAFDLPYDYTTMLFAPDTIEIQFDTKAKDMGFVNLIMPITSDKMLTIPMPADVRPDIYHAVAIFSGGHFHIPVAFDFMVRYPSSIIAQKWNNVLLLRDSSGNGGYLFDQYEWYINDQRIAGQTRSYLYLGEGNTFDFGQGYYAALQRQGEDYYVFTCPFVPTLRTDASIYESTLSSDQPFPSVVYAGQQICHAPEHSHGVYTANHPVEVTIYTAAGQLVSHQSVQMFDGECISFAAPTITGAYLVHISSNLSFSEIHHLLVLPQ